jgi:hypothetical protein
MRHGHEGIAADPGGFAIILCKFEISAKSSRFGPRKAMYLAPPHAKLAWLPSPCGAPPIERMGGGDTIAAHFRFDSAAIAP